MVAGSTAAQIGAVARVRFLCATSVKLLLHNKNDPYENS